MKWKKKLATCAALSGLAVGAIYLINKSISFVATIDNLLSKPEGNYYEWRFGKIFYTVKGEGKPLLLIHNLSAFSSAYEWSKVEDVLAKKNTVYTIDLLGCGHSDKPNITYTSFLYVQLISDFIKHIVGEKVDVISTGESSTFTLLACHNDNTIIDKIMLVNPTNLTSLSKNPTKRTKSLKFLLNIPILGTLLYNILATRKNVQLLFDTHYFYDPCNVTEKHINTYYEAGHLGNATSKYLFASMRGRFTNMNISHGLQALNNSVFIIVGNGDSENMEAAEQYKKLMPSIELTPINKTKYLPQLEDPHAFVEHVKILFEIEE